MKQKAAPRTTVVPPTVTVNYDRQAIIDVAMKVKGEGFIPAADLKAELGPEKFTRTIAILYSDYRMLRKVSRPWKQAQDVNGYEWADKRFSRSEAKKIPPEFGFLLGLSSPIAPKYGDYTTIRAHCRYTTPALGGCPVKDTDGQPINSFDRDIQGHLLILRYHQRAMITPGLAMIGKEQAIARRIGFSVLRFKVNGNLSKTERPVNDKGQGKGFCRSERLADGTEFTMTARVPTSVLSVAEYLEALRTAGETVGLSPGRSAGFGDFEVLSAE